MENIHSAFNKLKLSKVKREKKINYTLLFVEIKNNLKWSVRKVDNLSLSFAIHKIFLKTSVGLKVQYIRELHKGVQELFNSFPTIAVWAAVKFAYRPVTSKSGERRHKFSFVPLIRDSNGGSSEEDINNRNVHKNIWKSCLQVTLTLSVICVSKYFKIRQ